MKNLKILLSLFAFLIVLSSCAQRRQLSSSSKRAVKLYQEGKQYFNNKNLDKAITSLTKSADKDEQFIEPRVLLGIIYKAQKKYDNAILYFNQIVQINPSYYPPIFYQLGDIYIKKGEYDKAKGYLQTFLKYDVKITGMKEDAELKIRSCDFAKYAIKHPVDFNPINLGKGVNTKYPEYYPAMTADGQTLLFTRRLESNKTPTGLNEDFFVSYKLPDSTWGKARHLGSPINSLANEGAPTLSADGQVLIFTACDLMGSYGPGRSGIGSCDLFLSQLVGNKWSKPFNLGPGVNTRNWESQPSLASDGRTLYFVRGIRNRKGGKNYDIWVATLQDNGTFGDAHPLSNVINTSGREESVFIAADGMTLYFASDGHPGMGGTDLFMSKKDSDGNWTEPINLGYPINTSADESSILVEPNGEIAIFASDIKGGYGDLDFYSFKLPKDVQATPVTYFKGHVFDAESKQPLQAYFELKDLKTGKSVVQSVSNEKNGYFLVTLPKGREYALNVSKDGYLFYSENFTLDKPHTVLKPFKKDIPLQPIEVGHIITLKNVFFETAKYELKPKSKVELDQLVTFMNNNPSIHIELSGHTDAVGSAEDNLKLSQNRAKAVNDYLIKNGIDKERLTYKGYGKTRPIASNDTEEGRAENRRTEFKIIKK